MNYPMYDEHELNHASQDGSNEITSFSNFIGEIMDSNMFEGTEAGILALVDDKGTKALSPKQSFVLKKILSEFEGSTECKICGSQIPYDELFEAYNNGGYCSVHSHLADED